jgi:hypothetical protein
LRFRLKSAAYDVALLRQAMICFADKELKMPAINRKFYESWRGPAPTDQDSWWLVFDAETRRLLVRHEWQTSKHSGFDELEVAEFLKQTGGAQTALIDSLFLLPVDA